MAGRLLALLAEAPRLIVSLPANSYDLARAAADGGADALKIHLNVLHEASGTRFGGLAEERPALEQILSLGLPTGIVPGAGEQMVSAQDMRDLAKMGVDFFDLYAHHMPAWLTHFDGMTRTVAIDHTAEASSIAHFEHLGFEMLEAAVVPHEGYGKPLSVQDLVTYRQIRQSTALPIILPTQRAIVPDEVAVLMTNIGLNALMIGAIVTGREPDTLRAATQRFAGALAALQG